MRPFLKGPLTAQVARRAPRAHYPAPYAIIDLWARYGAHGSAAFEAEARSIARLFLTDTSRNLVRVFLLQDRLKAAGGKSAGELQPRARGRRRRHGRGHRGLVARCAASP